MEYIDILGRDEDVVEAISNWSTRAENKSPFCFRMNEITSKTDEKLPTSVCMTALVKSFAVHMWKVRNLWGSDKNIADICNVKYRGSIYSVVSSELVKSVFKINFLGDGVPYGQNKVMLLENGNYAPMSRWGPSNFNYLVLINAFDYMINQEYDCNRETLKNVTNDLKDKLNNKYHGRIDDATCDIQIYFKELKLYKFIKELYFLDNADKMSHATYIGARHGEGDDVQYKYKAVYESNSQNISNNNQLDWSYIKYDVTSGLKTFKNEGTSEVDVYSKVKEHIEMSHVLETTSNW